MGDDSYIPEFDFLKKGNKKMTYKCLECGHIFEYGEQVEWVEMHGEKFSGCPLCKGAYEETKRCASCGNESFTEDELVFNVCDECIDKYTKDFDFCIKVGSEVKEKVEINGAIASALTEDEINDILVAVIRNKLDISFEDFVNEDKSWFAQMIEDEVKK
jgi:DNA-directed RNA polymerase subunit RPC12/RpoP